MARRPIQRGEVTAFDDDAGLGEVTARDGQVHPFHCTAIAGGERSISVHTPVSFTLVPGRSGRWEADGLLPG